MDECERTKEMSPTAGQILTGSGCTVTLNFAQTPNPEVRKEIANMLLSLFEEKHIAQADG